MTSPTPSVVAVSVDGGQNDPTGDTNGPDTEVMLDIEVAGAVADGTVVYGTGYSYTLTATNAGPLAATDVVITDPLPVDWTVQVIRGIVDEAGASSPDPLVTRVNYPSSTGSLGALTVPVSTSTSCFVRVEVQDKDGVTRLYSNPVWLLRALPQFGIPHARLATKS